MDAQQRRALIDDLRMRVKELNHQIDNANLMVEDTASAGEIAHEEIQIQKMLTCKQEREKIEKTIGWLQGRKGGHCIICESAIQLHDLHADHGRRLCQQCISIIR